MDFVRQVNKEHPDASHHCFAWRLESGDTGWRAWDDGEPTGTAGKPILARIDGACLRGVVIVVSRYFGGTKLGKGGLIRAYGGVAGELISEAEIIEVRQTQTVQIQCAYGDQGSIMSVLAEMNLTPTQEQFGAMISMTIEVPIEQITRFQQRICDRTSGRVDAQVV